MRIPPDDESRRAFVLTNTRLLPVPHAPEISLHLADEATELWRRTEEELQSIGLPPPYWAFAWAGGQALARYVLDHPELVRARRVLDFAAGSGLVGIAAAKAGAADVVCADIDGFAAVAIALNGAANGVTLRPSTADLLGASAAGFDVILAGDVFYERPMANRVAAWTRDAARQGVVICFGDPGRAYLPRADLVRLAEYEVPTTRELEDQEIKRTAVWRFDAGALRTP